MLSCCYTFRAGGGYNAAPNGALLGPGRRSVIPPIDAQRILRNTNSLQVNKIGGGPQVYPQEQMSPQDAAAAAQWQQQQAAQPGRQRVTFFCYILHSNASNFLLHIYLYNKI